MRGWFSYSLLIVTLLPASVFSQDQRLAFETLSVEHSPWRAGVNSIIEDRKGLMWFATSDGLYRYDGYSFTVFRHDPADSTSIASSDVRSLLEDADGTIWVGSLDGGVNTYDRTTGRFSNFLLKDPADPRGVRPSVWALYQDSKGFVWIATGGGLIRFNKRTQSTTLFRHDPSDPRSLSSGVIRAVLEDRNGTIWIATWFGGVNRLHEATGTFKHYKTIPGDPQSISDNNVVSICEDSDGDLWFGTYIHGLNRFNAATETFRRYPKVASGNKGLNDNSPMAILAVRPGILWIATAGGALNVLDKATGTFTYETHNPSDNKSVASNFLTAFCQSGSGIIWIGTNDGVSKYVPRNVQFRTFDFFQRNPPQGEVTGIVEDREGDFWIGTYGGGLYRYSPSRRNTLQFKNDPGNHNSLSSNFVTCVFSDREGFVWVGTIAKGLNRLNPRSGKFELFVHDDNKPGSISHDAVNMIRQDDRGKLWLATAQGVDQFEGATKKFVHTIKGITDVLCLRFGSDNSLWLGTQFQGLFQYDLRTAKIIHYDSTDDSSSLARKYVASIHEDREGTLWVGTIGGGLDRFDREKKTFSHYTTKDGLPGSHVWSILSDDDGNLWIGTNNGLSRLDPRTGRFVNFDTDDGLADVRFSKACWQRRNGEILLGNSRGVTVFHPAHMSTNEHAPPVVLSSLSAAGRPVKVMEDIANVTDVSIHYDDKIVTFEFAALDYVNPDKNQFAYLLEGFEKDWTYAGTRRFVTYTNLDPGTYTLRVKGCNHDGVWNDAGTTLRLTVVPPFWMTWWFRTILAAVILAVVVNIYNWRVNILLENERARDRIARDLHDDVASTLSSISLYIANLRHKLRKPSRPTGALLEKISQLSLDTVDAMDDVVWSVAPQHDSFNDLILHMRDFASQMLTAHNIAYTVDIAKSPEDFRMPVEVRKNIYLIFKEAVNNIVKHSGATTVMISAGLQGNAFTMRIQDDGSGFTERGAESPKPGKIHHERNEPERGHGLRNMKKRASEMGAELNLQSIRAQGTTITLVKRMT